MKLEGMNVVGSTLDVTSAAVATINKGEAYYGDATISGKPYPAGCELIKLRVPGKRSRASL